MKKIENLTFKKFHKKSNFPAIKFLHKVNKHPSTSIIVNATNGISRLFFKKKTALFGPYNNY